MKKCLVVDDVEVTRFTVEQIVDSLGFEAISVPGQQEAIDALKKGSVDLVLLDWHLRKTQGLDLIGKIRELQGNKAKIVVFSGVEGADKEQEARQSGADAFLEKPTTKEKLQDCLKKIGAI
jgi:CheY-like chemotaxis protein